MIFKKNKLSIILNVIAMGAIAIIAIQYVYLFNVNYLNGYLSILIGDVSDTIATWILFALLLLICAALFVIGSFISVGLNNKIKLTDTFAGVIKTIFSIVVIIGAIAYKIWYVFGSSITLRDDSLYELSKITSNGLPSNFIGCEHGITYIYVVALYVFMLFLGNGAFSVVALQLAIQIISLLLIYGIGRRLFGVTTGIISVILYGLTTFVNAKLFDATPGCLLTLVILVGLYLVSIFFDMYNDGAKIAYAVLVGIIMGASLYLDASIVIVFVLWILGFIYELIQYNTNMLDEDEINPVVSNLILFGSSIIAFLAAVFLDAFLSNHSFVQFISTWFNINNSANLPFFYFKTDYFGFYSYLFCIILVALSLLGTFTFIKKKNTFDMYFLYLMLLAVALTPVTTMGYLVDDSFSVVIYSLLAGCGVRAIFMLKDEKIHAYDKAFEYIENNEKLEADNLGIKQVVEPGEQASSVDIGKDYETKQLEKAVELESYQEESSNKLNVTTNTKTEENVKEVGFENATKVEADDLVNPTKVESEDSEILTQVDDLPGMIKNPLPLPARRKHKQMEFSIEVNDDLMHFDTEIDDNDDFDV